MSAPRATALLAATAMALTACGTSADGGQDPASSSSAKGEKSASSSVSPTPTGPKEITLAFAGDVHFQDRVSGLATAPDGLKSLRPYLSKADLAMFNLETAITEGGSPMPKKFNFRAPESALETIDNAGVDVVSLANNHAVDYGPEGLEDTLAAKKDSPVPFVGIGKNAKEAYAPWETETGNVSVAVLGASQVREETLTNYTVGKDSPGIASNLPTDRMVAAVEKAAKDHDLVVVYLHWGLDYQNCPDQRSIDAAKDLEEAGADIVVGGHAHRFQGSGWQGKSYIGYGLGNFVWYSSRPYDKETGVLTLTVDAQAARSKPSAERTKSVVTDAEWTPMIVGDEGLPIEQTGAEAERLLDEKDARNECSGLAQTPTN